MKVTIAVQLNTAVVKMNFDVNNSFLKYCDYSKDDNLSVNIRSVQQLPAGTQINFGIRNLKTCIV